MYSRGVRSVNFTPSRALKRPCPCSSSPAPNFSESRTAPKNHTLALDSLHPVTPFLPPFPPPCSSSRSYHSSTTSSKLGGRLVSVGNPKKAKGPTTFEELGILPDVITLLEKEMGITVPSKIQELSITKLPENTHLVIADQPGTGKTLAYLLYMMQSMKAAEEKAREVGNEYVTANRPRGIIVVPTRELGSQIAQVAKLLSHVYKLRVRNLSGKVSYGKEKSLLESGVDILIATPQKVNFFLGKQWLFMKHVRHFVVEEADTLMQEDFMADLLPLMNPIIHRLGSDLESVRSRFLFVCATFTPELRDILGTIFQENLQVVNGEGLHIPSLHISQKFLPVSNREASLIEHVQDGLHLGQVIVFCNTVESARFAGHVLDEGGITTSSLNGRVSPTSRADELKAFASGKSQVLVCTDIASRGLDLHAVKTIVNFDFPRTVIDYIHRIGRTGRAGREGSVINLMSAKDKLGWDIVKEVKEAITESRQVKGITGKKDYRVKRSSKPKKTKFSPKGQMRFGL